MKTYESIIFHVSEWSDRREVERNWNVKNCPCLHDVWRCRSSFLSLYSYAHYLSAGFYLWIDGIFWRILRCVFCTWLHIKGCLFIRVENMFWRNSSCAGMVMLSLGLDGSLLNVVKKQYICAVLHFTTNSTNESNTGCRLWFLCWKLLLLAVHRHFHDALVWVFWLIKGLHGMPCNKLNPAVSITWLWYCSYLII